MNSQATENQQAGIDAGPPAEGEKKGKSRVWLWLLVLCFLGGGAYYLSHGPAQQAQQAKAKADAAKAGSRAVPVVTAAARRGEMGIFLDGLGSVVALNTVTVHTRVDGELVKVAFTEGQMVKQGDLLLEIDPRPYQVQLEQAEGQLAHDQALLANANIDLDRYKILYAQDAIPKQQLDTQVALVNQYVGTIKSDQAAIDNAKLQLVYCRITAPLTGRIGLRLIDQGNMVHATDTMGLLVITQLQPIALLFSIAEDSIPQVLQKMHGGAKLRVDAYDHDMKQKLATGELLTIDNQIDPNSGTLRFKAIFPNEDNALFPMQFVNAKLLIDTKRGTVLIPTAAVQRSPQGTYVYVVKADNTAEVRNITLGPVSGDEAAIDDGVEPGEIVVIEGVDKLQDGSKVIPPKAAAAGGSGAAQGKGAAAARPGARPDGKQGKGE
ncbi:MAG: MdtA/MuxA family multidrug efflux RND transporter periplasmic adaptor subunit [Bryobacteraceae bacterium]